MKLITSSRDPKLIVYDISEHDGQRRGNTASHLEKWQAQARVVDLVHIYFASLSVLEPILVWPDVVVVVGVLVEDICHEK